MEIEGLKEPNNKKDKRREKQKRQVTRLLIMGHYYPLLDKRVTCKNMPNIVHSVLCNLMHYLVFIATPAFIFVKHKLPSVVLISISSDLSADCRGAEKVNETQRAKEDKRRAVCGILITCKSLSLFAVRISGGDKALRSASLQARCLWRQIFLGLRGK